MNNMEQHPTPNASQVGDMGHAAAPPAAPAQPSTRGPRTTNPRSCNLCRQRKIKCDRGNPCSHCMRTRDACVSSPSSNAPRRRPAGRRKFNSELLDRIARLENLVKDIGGGDDGAIPPMSSSARQMSEDSEVPHSKGQPRNPHPKASAHGLDRYLGANVWMNLSEEINGLHEILIPSDDEDDYTELTPETGLHIEEWDPSTFVINAPDTCSNTLPALKHPDRSQVHSLYQAFATNVDPPAKILHLPSLRRYLIEESGELHCSPGPKGMDALEFAIYYVSTTSLTPEECLQLLGEEKHVLLRRFRSSTEVSLARADFVNTEELSTLQALVLYLDSPRSSSDNFMKYAVRSNENSRRTWTLTSLAVRIAHALGLHREPNGHQYTSPSTPFDREMRRRLWWNICVLDRQGCADRGSDPIINKNSFNTQLPLHLNDEDLIPGDLNEVQARDEYTDMTLGLACHEVFELERRLNYNPAGEAIGSQDRTNDPFPQRKERVLESQRRVKDRYLRHCDMTVPIQRYTVLVVDVIFATMWLLTYRPQQKHPDSLNYVKVSPSGILHLSVEVMEKTMRIPMDPSTRPFAWITSTWVQWHALAVMIAELCVQTEGPTVERAWAIADTVFEETARHVADSDKGRLWRPIKKLMNKAQAVRKNHLQDATVSTRSPTTGVALKHTDTTLLWTSTQASSLHTGPVDTEGTLLGDAPGLAQQIRSSRMSIESTTFDWETWLAMGSSDGTDYDWNLNEQSWTNWLNVVDDFQANGEFLRAQEDAVGPTLHFW